MNTNQTAVTGPSRRRCKGQHRARRTPLWTVVSIGVGLPLMLASAVAGLWLKVAGPQAAEPAWVEPSHPAGGAR